MTTAGPPLLRVRDLSVHFPGRRGLFGHHGVLRAVDGVSFDLHAGQTLGVVGESGCGKSTLARALLRLVPAAAGELFFDGRPLLRLSRRQMRPLRRRMQIVFQDPAGSLNPHARAWRIVAEPMLVHRTAPRRELRRRATELLERCGLAPDAAERRPHEFSGGQRQRIGIARALALQPDVLICDEPTSALDVSVQAQILNLLRDLQEQSGMALLLISHDLAVVSHVAGHVAVMRQGRIIEHGPAGTILTRPEHDYTRALLAAAA